MKNTIVLLALLIVFSPVVFSQADKIVGKWKTIDDKDGSEKSIIYLFKATNGMYYGKIDSDLKVNFCHS
jgi:hypothetical protein